MRIAFEVFAAAKAEREIVEGGTIVAYEAGTITIIKESDSFYHQR